jgi:hypothetical protein
MGPELDRDSRDAVAVQAEVAHQASVGHHEPEDFLARGLARDLSIGADIDHRHRSIGTDGPATAGFESLQSVLGHEKDEHRLGLRSREQTRGRLGHPEVSGGLPALAQHALAAAAADGG